MFDFSVLATTEGLIALVTLTFLEIVLGIDNIIFISIVADKLPQEQQPRARFIGLALALLMRIGLLFGITWLIGLTAPVFTVFDNEISWRDIILIIGGLFLLGKSTSEIHHKMQQQEEGNTADKVAASFAMTILQIVLLDIVFSFDSILTAVGLTDAIIIMIIAVIISIVVMMIFSAPIANFVNRNPTLQILALAFLILIGFTLILEALDVHIEKGFVYFAVGFSLIIELINMRVRKVIKKNKSA